MLSSISSASARRSLGDYDSYSFSTASRETVLKRYQVIESLIKPAMRPARLHIVARPQKKSRVKTINRVAKQHGLSQRTIYNWLRAWNRGGLPALARKIRSDKGCARGQSTL